MLRHSTAVSLWRMARKPMAPHGQAESKNDSKSGSHGHASALTSDYAGLQIILSEMISERLRSINEYTRYSLMDRNRSDIISALTSDYAGLQIILSEMISERLRSIKE